MGLHRRIGAILEQQHACDTEPALGELPTRFVAAAPEAAVEAVDYFVRAARRALASLAYEEAVSDRALEALELSKSPDEATRCELLLGLGESLGKASEFDRSRAAFQAAAELARTVGLGEHLARAAPLGLGRGWIEQARRTWRSSRCCRRRSPLCPTPVRRCGPGCSAASPWSFTSRTSPSAARRWHGRPWRSPEAG